MRSLNSSARLPVALCLAAACLAATVLPAGDAAAHSLGESYLYLQVEEEAVSGRFEIALSNLNDALGWTGTAEAVTAENLDRRIGWLERYYRDHVTISVPATGETLALDFTGYDVLDAHGSYARLSFDLPGLEDVPQRLAVDYSVLFDEDPSHRGFLLIEYNWATGTFANENQVSLVFRPGDTRQELDLTTSGRWRGFLAVVHLGIEHIWEGVDHILFLVALLLPAVLRREDGRWQAVDRLRPALVRVIQIVTAFTLAHSVTLSLAALGWVSLPGKLVEVLIAASIAIAAADLLVPIFRGRIWLVVVGFGLFHGFGFAGALSEMGVLGEHRALSLLAFNLGVEIGQLAIVAVLVPLLFAVRRLSLYRTVAVRVAAVGMILISCAWIVERAFEVDLPISELADPVIERIKG